MWAAAERGQSPLSTRGGLMPATRGGSCRWWLAYRVAARGQSCNAQGRRADRP